MEFKRYHHAHLQLCRICKGNGMVNVYDKKDIFSMNASLQPCPNCLGSGRVTVSREIITTVKPYKPTKNE